LLTNRAWQPGEGRRRWLLAEAQAADDAGKEGGFLGFGGEQLSAGTSGCWTKCAPRSRWPEPSTPFSPASGDAGRTPGPKNGRRRMPGVLPQPAPADPEVVVDADVLDAVAADGVRDQEPAR
jgi:hypothetical protein